MGPSIADDGDYDHIDINFVEASNGLNIYTSSGYLLNYSAGLAYNYFEPKDRGNVTNCWKLIPVEKTIDVERKLKDALINFDKSNSSITYIDQYGLPVTLEHICRNDDVNIVINIFYSPESGVLYFRVEDWDDETNDTTFD